jgi:hypothetical protein
VELKFTLVVYTYQVERELAESRESISETVRWISDGPNRNVLSYEVYDINGFTFRTKSREGKVHQNSGVSVVANDLHISREVKTYTDTSYYGVLQDIWILDYHFRKIPLFKCDWVDNKNRVKKDGLGYTLVELSRLGHKDDPFILGSQARQVFYVTDQLDKKMSIVIKNPPTTYTHAYEDEEFSTVISYENENVLPPVDKKDLGKESRDDYYRKDGRDLIIRTKVCISFLIIY